MVRFILNDQLIQTVKSPGMTLLDFIRYHQNLKGTKIGCREGDCGACTVIEGRLVEGKMHYQTLVSCLTPLGNVNGKHIVTVEGINMEKLSPVQQLLVEHNGTQCGFCTPGFVVSLTSFLLSVENSPEKAIAAVDGNICRCTGYKSIERAAHQLCEIKAGCNTEDPVECAIRQGFVPDYFSRIIPELNQIPHGDAAAEAGPTLLVGGGTDLLVQKPDEIFKQDIRLVNKGSEQNKIVVMKNYCSIDGTATATNIMQSEILQKHLPRLYDHFKLIASTPIRNMGTVAGNIANASPIGDLSIYFLALSADVYLIGKQAKNRTVPLSNFFIGYKKRNLHKGEMIRKIGFPLPGSDTLFNFEKVSKRQYLDIASVNSALMLAIDNGKITEARLSAGGVAPIPLFLEKASGFLAGREVNAETVVETNKIAQQEISPISDIRGSVKYKRLLLRQLLFAHFMQLFPEKILINELLQKTEHEQH